VIIATEAFTAAIGCSTSVVVIPTMLPPVFCASICFNRELSDVDIAFQIGGRERLEVLRRIGSERLRKEYARIIDERVDRPEFGYSGLGNFRSGCGLTNVAIDQRQLV
jgi:hypothetical protein